MPRLHAQDITPMLAALHAGEFQLQHAKGETGPPTPRPFVTISRQAGAGGRSLANQLIDRLNHADPGALPWTVWDNELVERVAGEYHLPASRVAAMEDVRPSWLEEALGGLTISGGGGHTDELAIYHRVAATIHALAELGRVVIVGRGSAFVTSGLKQGVHVRLVAPLDFRVAATAQSLGISRNAAADWVRDTDRAREAFYRRHWPGRPMIPENFTMTLNTAALTIPQQVEAVSAALPLRQGAAMPPAIPAPAGTATLK